MKKILILLMLMPLIGISQIKVNDIVTGKTSSLPIVKFTSGTTSNDTASIMADDSIIYVGNKVNATSFYRDGTLRLIGNATCFEDLTASSLSFAAGANAPTIREINSTGTYGTCYNFQTANDISYISLQMSHTYKDGSAVSPHIHYYIEADGTATDTAYFKVVTNWTNIHDTINATTTISKNYKVALNGKKANIIYILELDDLIGTNMSFSSQFTVTIERLQSTTAIDTYNNWFCILDYDIHYEVDSFGTRLEYTK